MGSVSNLSEHPYAYNTGEWTQADGEDRKATPIRGRRCGVSVPVLRLHLIDFCEPQ